MGNYKIFIKKLFFHQFANSLYLLILIILSLTIIFFLACAENKMSLDEAKNVTTSMREEAFVSPPRRIDDILSVLEQPGNYDPETVKKLKSGVSTTPPATDNENILADFYLERGKNALSLGLMKQDLEDFQKALKYAEKKPGKKNTFYSDSNYKDLLFFLSIAEARYGNYNLAIDYIKKSLKLKQHGSRYVFLAHLYLNVGDFDSAQNIIKQGVRYCDKITTSPGMGRSKVWAILSRAQLKATYLEAFGHYKKAEPYRREAVNLSYKLLLKSAPLACILSRVRLAENLASQGRFIDAEFEIRKAIQEIIGLGGKNVGSTGDFIQNFGHILLLQGRVGEAEIIIQAGIKILQASGISYDSTALIDAILNLCSAYVAKRNFAGAIQQYDQIAKHTQANQFYFKKNIAQNQDLILSLIKTSRADEALSIISEILPDYSAFFGTKHPLTAQILALRGAAQAAVGKTQNAFNDFSKAIPVLLSVRTETENNFLKKMRLQFIIEEYLKLLGDIYKAKLEKQLKIDVSMESFKLVQILLESAAGEALGAISARAAPINASLADLVRREQDARKQIQALQTTLQNILSIPSQERKPDAISELNQRISIIRKSRIALADEIKRQFPKYSDLTNPQPVSLAATQKSLHSNEAILTVIPTSNETYVWAIPSNGPITFKVLNLTDNDIKKAVDHLRMALDPKPQTFGDIPDFDLEVAYSLYRELLVPIKSGWETAEHLIIIAPGPLGQIPISVLPTQNVKLENNETELFSNYRKVPWLIRKVSIARLPSIFAFVSLRKMPVGDPDRKAFVGFGDPLFNRKQLSMAAVSNESKEMGLLVRQNKMRVRGIRVSNKGNLDSSKITSVHLEDLRRLPETAEEIKSIASILGADPQQDIFLGINASESRVKTMDLTDRRIIAFASHAMIPGDLDGLSQPAIALSSPTVTGEDEDGILTMEEILKLKLDADWVILSSCNSGASDGKGAEALSGLGQAFFYAGTRALLVSMWPVETTSAEKLSTGLFRNQNENKEILRAEALRRSMLELIDGPGLTDSNTGKIVASYAHPIFWAPFILVGDNGMDIN